MPSIEIGNEADLQELSNGDFSALFRTVSDERWRRIEASMTTIPPIRDPSLAHVSWDGARDLLALPGSPAKNASHHASRLWSKLSSMTCIHVIKLEMSCSHCELVQEPVVPGGPWSHHKYGCPYDKLWGAKMPAFTERSLIFQEKEIKELAAASFPQWLVDDALFIIKKLRDKQ